MKPSPDLLTQAIKCRFCQSDIRSLGEALPTDDNDLDTLLEVVADSHNPQALTNIILAILMMNRPLHARHLIKAFEQIDDITMMLAFAGHCCGDLITAMLTAVQNGHMSWERETMALYIGAWNCQEKGIPIASGLVTQARLLARKVSTPEARSILLAAAHLMDDKDLWSILDAADTPSIRFLAEKSATNLVPFLQRPISDSIPETPPPNVLQGGTVRRAVSRVGRNEPCPCGSGKKYKRCCQEKDNERLRDSSEIAGVTRQEQNDSPEEYLTAERIWDMRPHEVAALDPSGIVPELVGSYINRLKLFDEYEAILRYLESQGVPKKYEENIVEAAEYAMRSHHPETARKIAAFVPDYVDCYGTIPLSFLFAQGNLELGPTLELIESAAMESLDRISPTDFCCALFHIGCPALGIMAGRGAIAYSDLWEAETVLAEIEAARDRLELSPTDFAEEIYDERLMERAESSSITMNQSTAEHAQLKAATARATELEKKLAAKEMALKTAMKAASTRQRDVVVETPVPSVPVSPDSEMKHLLAEISTLKKDVKENHQERNRYRRMFKTAVSESEAVGKENLEIRAELEANLAATEALEDDSPDLLSDELVAANNPVRVPVFSDKFRSEMNRLPEDIVRKSVHLAGRLAAGEEAAFHGAKRLVANREIIRQRIGAYRMLFRLGDGELDVVECVHRGDLVKAVKGLV